MPKPPGDAQSQPDQTAPAPQPYAVPPGTRCINCGYDIAGCPQGPCPECGFPIGPVEIDRWHKRVGWESRYPLRKVIIAAAVLPLVYAAGAAIFGKHIEPGIAALLATSLTLLGSFVTGEILAWLGDPINRRLTRRVWMKNSLFLQFPWVAAAPAAAVALAVALLERAFDGSGAFLVIVTILGAVLWLSGSLGFFIVACISLGTVRRTHALRWTTTQKVLIIIAVLLQIPANCFAGLIGGMLAASGAADLAGIDWWTQFD